MTPDVVGYPLDEARALLDARTVELRLTAPPRATGRGRQRVVRQREIEGRVELVVVWEQYERASRPSRPSRG
ncbi:MAG: hypothetical protein QN163_09080 [Armatimonadota bacterium]|nr:hypothetical protein [Armatimonadota bacterium]MDR5697745.1 hypothetical protein [Armatimonadota bacterium]